jgi:hypothetical protein
MKINLTKICALAALPVMFGIASCSKPTSSVDRLGVQ